jgi:2-polyprenyl-6-methoxyphenol hydroxylase-like FAD-dependent oxidoreductase
MKICIVGGGLAGLAYAISAAKVFREEEQETAAAAATTTTTTTEKQQNNNDTNHQQNPHEIVVVEKRDFSNRGATFGLARSGQASMEIFAPDLLQELKEIGILIPSTGGYMLPWYRVRDGLLDRAKNESLVRIVSNTTVTSIVDSIDNVAVTFERSHDEDNVDDVPLSPPRTGDNDKAATSKSETLHFDYVVGSDGVNSFVRQALGSPPAVSSETLCWRGAVSEIPDDLTHLVEGPIARTYYHKKGIFAIFNFHKSMKNFLSWVATSKDLEMKSIVETLDDFDSESDRKDVKRLLEISNPQELTFRTLLCTVPMDDETGWGGKGRVTLIGDAAHALRPASGLGGSLAFEDVALLSRCLKSKTTTQIPEALREFETLRFTRCKTIVDDQTRLAEVAYVEDREAAVKKLEWTPEYREWVFTGPDADPNPPSKMYVDSE